MKPLVIDCSVTMAWCFPDEQSDLADAAYDELSRAPGIASSIWPLEVANVLVVAERQKRLTQADSDRFLGQLRQVPIAVDDGAFPVAWDRIVFLARRYQRSAYDASYLELATRCGARLASLDGPLLAAAKAMGIEIFRPQA